MQLILQSKAVTIDPYRTEMSLVYSRIELSM